MLTPLHFFRKKENRIWGKDALLNIMGDSTDVVMAVEEFNNINKDNAVSALDGFVYEENDDWDILFDQSLHCVWYFLKDLFQIRMKKKWMSHP